MKKQRGGPSEQLIAETIGYLHGLAAAFEIHRGLRSESVVVPSPEAYARTLAARLTTYRRTEWPIE